MLHRSSLYLRVWRGVALCAVILLLPSCMMHDRFERPSYRYAFTQADIPTGIITPRHKRLDSIREKNISVLRTEMAMKGLSLDSPMLIRAFKSEMKLELWVKNSYGNRYGLFKTYDICKKSGYLGPKLAEGDKQTPEGFYNVTPARLNPNSQFFLSFNIGFPNAFDQAHGRTGSNLMIHGDCVSEGCLAMTNQTIGEIYMIIEQNFRYGHASTPVHIYPFRMTEENMRLYRTTHWYPFWQNLKQGHDYFEKYRMPVAASYAGGRYVFNQGGYATISHQ